MRRLPAVVTLFVAMMVPVMTTAAAVSYTLDAAASTVAFEADFGPDIITGQIPLVEADLTLDFDDVQNSSVTVALDVAGAEASFPFAAQALKGAKVLDAKTHPRMTFQSTAVTRAGDAADITGQITIRGVTRPITLRAELFRPQGSAETDFNRLTIRLTGRLNRSDFGASGWSDLVGDEVRIRINARINAKG